jgi:hypothetical protein
VFRVSAIALVAASLVLVGTVISAASAQNLTGRQELEGCPRPAPREVARNPWPRAKRALAPHGVRVINLCRYAPTSNGRFKLAGNDLVSTRSTIRRLIHKFDALKRYHGPPLHCPGFYGDEVLATLYYRWHTVKVIVQFGGCATASNGDLTRPAFDFDGQNPAGPRLLHQLKRLTHRRHFYV